MNHRAVIPVLILCVSACYFGWELWGLRFTNGDDIVFYLQAFTFSADKMGYAAYVAGTTGRLQAFINMPLSLAVVGLGNSPLYDLLNIGSILGCYVGVIYLLSKIGSLRDATIVVSVALLLFPLHYYYSFPQGYAVMACWPLIAALFSAGMLASYLHRPTIWMLIVSVFLFFCSLWGTEYNFVLHPILPNPLPLLGGMIPDARRLARILFPYLVVWTISLTAYATFSITLHAIGADSERRIVPGFDVGAAFKAFPVFEEKRFSPFALFRGISLNAATAQGVPKIPPLLTFHSLLACIPDGRSLLLIGLCFWAVFGLALYCQRIGRRAAVNYSIMFMSLVVIPNAILVASERYQQIVLAGWIQGHLVTFYVQLGMAGLLFVFLATLCNLSHDRARRFAVVAVCAGALAAIGAITLVYNNVNRQVMSANSQKWDAMLELVQFARSQWPKPEKRTIYAPDFWTISGVSAFPPNKPVNAIDYWSRYSKHHWCPARSRIESIGCCLRANHLGSRRLERPVKWAFFQRA